MTRTSGESIRRPNHRHNSTTAKIVSASLATATCIGVVGVLGVRAAEEASASDLAASSQNDNAQTTALTVATSSSGMTQADLDAYAAQLEQERQKLVDYRAKLVEASTQIQQSSTGNVSIAAVVKSKAPAKVKPTTKTKPKKITNQALKQPVAATKPAPVSAPQPAPRPQSNTKSS
ncbi:MAG: hypothetical protein WCJ73_06625 [Actinomycetes bacterium]